jgi:hypothetical protein
MGDSSTRRTQCTNEADGSGGCSRISCSCVSRERSELRSSVGPRSPLKAANGKQRADASPKRGLRRWLGIETHYELDRFLLKDHDVYVEATIEDLNRDVATLERLGCVDIDAEIEATEGKAISHIFKERGEAVFREIETEVIKAHVRKV